MANSGSPITWHPFHDALEELFNWADAQNKPLSRAALMRHFRWPNKDSLSGVLSEMLGAHIPNTGRSVYKEKFGPQFEVRRVETGMYSIRRRTAVEETSDPQQGELLEIQEHLDNKTYIVRDEQGTDWLCLLARMPLRFGE